MGKSNSHSIKVIERSTLKNENVDSNAFPASNPDTILVGRISDLLEDIAEKFSLTRERVRQIKEKGLKRLRFTSRSKTLKSFLG